MDQIQNPFIKISPLVGFPKELTMTEFDFSVCPASSLQELQDLDIENFN